MSSRCRRISARDDEGFTLLEVVVSMALLMMALTSMMTVFTSIQRTTVKQDQRVNAADAARTTLERITKDLRQADSFNAASGPAVLDMQTYVNGVATRVIYSAAGSTLTRTVGTASQPILGSLSSTTLFTFAPSITSPTLVSVSLGVYPYRNDTDNVVSLKSDVRLRNR